jgi:hypothetical protein
MRRLTESPERAASGRGALLTVPVIVLEQAQAGEPLLSEDRRS